MRTRGGTGMKNQELMGIGYLKKFKYGSSRVQVHVKLYQKTLASLAKWSIDTKVWNMCLQQRQIFHGHRIFQPFYHVTSIKSINIVFETGEYHSWSNTLMRTPKKTMRGVINATIKIGKVLIRHVHMRTLFWFHKKSTDLQRKVKANLH